MQHFTTIRAGRIMIVRHPSLGHVFRSTRAAVLMRGNDGNRGFEVQASSVRRCRVLAKRQGIRFPRRPAPLYPDA